MYVWLSLLLILVGVENFETPPTFIMHGNISNVERVHYVATTNYVKVEIMQHVVI
jgi:hypothetical protein